MLHGVGDMLQGVNKRVADMKSERLDAAEFEKETDNVIQFSVSARAIPRVLVHDLTPTWFPFTRTRTNSKFIVSVSYIPVQHRILLTSVWQHLFSFLADKINSMKNLDRRLERLRRLRPTV